MSEYWNKRGRHGNVGPILHRHEDILLLFIKTVTILFKVV